MRALAILVASILAFGGLAGCIGGDKDDPVDKNNVNGATSGGSTTGGTTTTGGAAAVKVLSALASSVTIDAPAWIQSGTEVPVKATAPANAKGAVTYTWAVGALPGTTTVTAVPMDTGSDKSGGNWIQPGASKSLTFSTAGVYNMHCHPHPYMRHNVTVVDGYAGPKDVEVLITDGASPKEYLFYPENIVVGVGTKVTYKNVGQQPHTSTALGAQEPALKALPLKAENGTAKIEGEGWLRVVAIVQDSEGRIGFANKSIYATKTLPAFAQQTLTFEFTHGTPAQLAGTPAEASGDAKPLTLEQAGKITLNYTFADALSANGAPENLAEVAIHLVKDGETQDSLTGGPAPVGTLEGKIIAGAYTLTVIPLQGAEITGSVVVDVVYDLVPPEPAGPAPAGGVHGDHGDHGGH